MIEVKGKGGEGINGIGSVEITLLRSSFLSVRMLTSAAYTDF